MTHPTDLTPERVRELLELAAKATPGPWRSNNKWYYEVIRLPTGAPDDGGDIVCNGWNARDMEFIAAAREALPVALRELEALRAENARLREALDCAIRAAWDGPEEMVGTNCSESYVQWRKRMEETARRALGGEGEA